MKGIEDCLQENVGLIEVGYLLSIDRRLGVEEADDTVNLAIEYVANSESRVLGMCSNWFEFEFMYSIHRLPRIKFGRKLLFNLQCLVSHLQK